ncbi:hypothetical protein NIES4072_65730 [Nostoc commune NIES-4072]|uniref:Uncharacterized protein n=1 Tax=Nostoc commune NIES-4072 TaxID=2005467 RepID=A0A2R5G482_NOSCO|nr:hypothetical protein [Nostoc commune]BBD70207.1 hypothetical protein NIES4070_66180 [Nostoc commune HK-02]GBG22861.1 hypothetical protein NIES4072_65730 [Nostoc commune NIES-4072]
MHCALADCGKHSHAVRLRYSSSVNSSTSAALTVIVAELGSTCWEISSFAELAAEVESVDGAEVALLRLEGGLGMIPPFLVQ